MSKKYGRKLFGELIVYLNYIHMYISMELIIIQLCVYPCIG